MKKILLPVLFATCVLLIFSCHKDSKVIPADYYFKASKNNADWGATSTAFTIPGDSVRFASVRPASNEYLNITIKFNGIGKYLLNLGQAELYTAVGGDAITDRYRRDTTVRDTLVVKSYSQSTHIAMGTFKLHLLKVSPNPNEFVPVFFDNGLFRVKMPE